MLILFILQDELKAILSEAKANPNMQYITAGVRQRQFPLLTDLNKVMSKCAGDHFPRKCDDLNADDHNAGE